jgi:hypothetical protein
MHPRTLYYFVTSAFKHSLKADPNTHFIFLHTPSNNVCKEMNRVDTKGAKKGFIHIIKLHFIITSLHFTVFDIINFSDCFMVGSTWTLFHINEQVQRHDTLSLGSSVEVS